MVHLLVLRSVPSFVQAPNAVVGSHEMIEEEINRRRYKYEGVTRTGFHSPHSSEWKLMEYRVKSEVLPEFIRDLGGIILNPENNKVTLLKLIIGDKKKISENQKNKRGFTCDNHVGRAFMLIQYLFRWFNRINYLLKLTTITTVPAPAPGDRVPFSNNWGVNLLIAVVQDVKEEYAPGVWSDKL